MDIVEHVLSHNLLRHISQDSLDGWTLEDNLAGERGENADDVRRIFDQGPEVSLLLFQPLIGLLALRDIAENTDHNEAAIRGDRCQARLDEAARSVRSLQESFLYLPRLKWREAREQDTAYQVTQLFQCIWRFSFGRDQVELNIPDEAPQYIVAGETGDALHAPVPLDHRAALVDESDAVVDVLHDAAELPLACLQCRVGLGAPGLVARVDHNAAQPRREMGSDRPLDPVPVLVAKAARRARCVAGVYQQEALHFLDLLQVVGVNVLERVSVEDARSRVACHTLDRSTGVLDAPLL